jgi:signal transduction histidine kinase
MLHPDDRNAVRAAAEAAVETGTFQAEFRIVLPNGSIRWERSQGRVASLDGGARRAVGALIDMTEERSLLMRRDAAEDANRTKSAFLATMSHEPRTPLNAIIGYSQMLREGCIGPEQPEVLSDLEKIERSGQRLLGIINDVLDLSKIEAGRIDVRLQNVDVATVLEDVCNTIEPLAREQGDCVSLDCSEEARLAYADLPKLRQSLLNLVNNACKFTQNGQVSVVVRRVRGGSRD